jgi:hypothetical protein
MKNKEKIAELTAAFMEQTPEERTKDPDQHTVAQALIQLTGQARLFHTPEEQAFASVPVGRHSDIFPVRGKKFRLWLLRAFLQIKGKPPGGQALQDAIDVTEVRALFDSPESPLYVRVADHEGYIYLDLCNAEREVVEITPNGWRVIDEPSVNFRRPRGMRSLPRPQVGGSIGLLRKYINVGDDINWILLISWLVAACRGKGPYPILIILGEQGSAKSTMVKIVRLLIDPAVAPVRTPPRNDRHLLIAASNSLVVAYDNMSCIPPWLSDALCRIATSGGLSARELYTDSEEVLFDATRPVILNGIDHLAERPDLADRALILTLPTIHEEGRRDEAQLYAELERDLPSIFGGLCTALSCALRRLPEIKLARMSRMADFAQWATAAEPAFGLQPGAFMDVYTANRAEAVKETLENDLVGGAVMTLMDRRFESGLAEQWEGNCKELLPKLGEIVGEAAQKSRDWPKNPRGLSERLKRLATFLRAAGVQVISPNSWGTNGKRVWTLTRATGYSTVSTATTVTPSDNFESVQSVTNREKGDGSGSEVTVAPGAGDGPPLQTATAKPLSASRKDARVTEVTVETVEQRTDLDEASELEERFEL